MNIVSAFFLKIYESQWYRHSIRGNFKPTDTVSFGIDYRLGGFSSNKNSVRVLSYLDHSMAESERRRFKRSILIDISIGVLYTLGFLRFSILPWTDPNLTTGVPSFIAVVLFAGLFIGGPFALLRPLQFYHWLRKQKVL